MAAAAPDTYAAAIGYGTLGLWQLRAGALQQEEVYLRRAAQDNETRLAPKSRVRSP